MKIDVHIVSSLEASESIRCILRPKFFVSLFEIIVKTMGLFHVELVLLKDQEFQLCDRPRRYTSSTLLKQILDAYVDVLSLEISGIPPVEEGRPDSFRLAID